MLINSTKKYQIAKFTQRINNVKSITVLETLYFPIKTVSERWAHAEQTTFKHSKELRHVQQRNHSRVAGKSNFAKRSQVLALLNMPRFRFALKDVYKHRRVSSLNLISIDIFKIKRWGTVFYALINSQYTWKYFRRQRDVFVL